MVKLPVKKNILFDKFAFIGELYKFLLISRYAFSLNKGITIGIIMYIVGLISVINSTANMVADCILGVSHDTITRAICTLNDNFYPVVMFVINSVQSKTAVPGWLIIDDVLLHKENSKHTDFVFKVKDHTTGKYTFGIQVVVLLWSNGIVKIPLGFKVYLTKEAAAKHNRPFKTKLQLAQQLLESPIISAIPFEFITFDTWYSSKELLNYLQDKGFKYITMVKCNRLFKIAGKRLHQGAQNIAASFAVTQYRYNRKLGFYIKGMETVLKGVGTVKLIIVKKGYRASIKQTRFIVTNMFQLSAPATVAMYLRRWDIEVFFRTTKQLLSLEDFIFQKANAIMGHLCSVFLAYFFLEYLRVHMSQDTIGKVKVLLFSLHEVSVDGTSFKVYNFRKKQHVEPQLPDKNLIATIILNDRVA